MDVVDLDKVLDDFEFNEQNAEVPIEQSQTKVSNNNEFELPPVSGSDSIKMLSKDLVLSSVKGNLDTPITFTNMIEYINTSSNHLPAMQTTKIPEKISDVDSENVIYILLYIYQYFIYLLQLFILFCTICAVFILFCSLLFEVDYYFDVKKSAFY